MPEPQSAADGAQKKPGGILREWVIPIAVGLALGVGIVKAWQHRSHVLEAFDSSAWQIVARWELGSFEENEKLGKQVKELGKEARADLLAAFRRIEVPTPAWNGEDEWKAWTGTLLVEEPFFDARSLLEICKSASAPPWDRRCAAAALVQSLRKDVDPTAVTPPLLEWLEDGAIIDHNIAITAVRQLRNDGIFPPDQDDRLRKVLVALSGSEGRPKAEDEDEQAYISTDRSRALRFAGTFGSHDDVKAVLWEIAGDETDDPNVRSVAIQTIAGNGQFTDVALWVKLATSKDAVVRQMVADNLGGAPDPSYDSVLVPFHTDAAPMVRKSSIEAQVQRKRATMLAVMHQLLEDSEPWVRNAALIACGAFKDHLDGMGARQGHILRLLETSELEEDISGAILALHAMTGQSFGFEPADIDAANGIVNENALAAFQADAEGRKLAVDKWRKHLGGAAIYTDDDLRKVLEAMRTHADPDNVARAEAELLKLGGGK